MVAFDGMSRIFGCGIGDCVRRPRPTQAGDKPPRYIFLPLLESFDGALAPAPDPGPGHAFVPMTGRAGGNDRTVDYPVAKRASELGRGAERPPNFAQTGTPAVEQKEGAEHPCR